MPIATCLSYPAGFARATVSETPPPAAGAKYFQGYAAKLNPGEVMVDSDPFGTVNTTALNTIFAEMDATPAWKAVKHVFHWGQIETDPNPANWNMKEITALVQRLHLYRQSNPSNPKYLFIAFSFKGDISILPPDMRTPGTYTPAKTDYTRYQYAWPFVPNPGALITGGGYYIKTWDTFVQNRFQQFIEKLGNYVVPGTDGKGLDVGDYLYMASSLESVVQTLYDSNFPGWSKVNHEDGVRELVRRMKIGLPNTMVAMCLNFDRPLLPRAFSDLNTLKIGVNTPNSNYSTGLVVTGTNPGILTYFQDPAYVGKIFLNPEIQGDDYYSTYGQEAKVRAAAFAKESPPNWAAVDAEYDFPSYSSLHLRCKNTLNANIIVAQRNSPFWLGGTYSERFPLADGSTTTHTFPGTRPSFLNFLRTDPDVIAWAGVENPTKPINWL